MDLIWVIANFAFLCEWDRTNSTNPYVYTLNSWTKKEVKHLSILEPSKVLHSPIDMK